MKNEEKYKTEKVLLCSFSCTEKAIAEYERKAKCTQNTKIKK